jgi:hypothetical protein
LYKLLVGGLSRPRCLSLVSYNIRVTGIMCNINEITAAREVLMSVNRKADMGVAGTAGEGSRAGVGVRGGRGTFDFELRLESLLPVFPSIFTIYA